MTMPIDFSRSEIPSLTARVVRVLLVGWLITAGLWYAVSSLLTIANFGWTQLAYDQFRSYTSTLGMPFPDNVMVLENGHRPIIPALLRVIEIHAFAANQYLQLSFGALCATLVACVVAATSWREPGFNAPVRAAGVLFAFAGIFWLGNARMLLHGNESISIYFVILCVLAGALMVRRSAADGRAGWMVGATMACVLATFCFAAGVTLFPTFAVLAWLLGARWRHISIILAVAALCAGLYLFVLSGDGGVRASLDFRPIDSVIVAARWLASPWITGWLGFADPQTHGIVLSTPLGLAMKNSANFLQSLLHISWSAGGAALIGMAGLIAVATSVIAKAFRRGPMTSTRTIAIALMMFAAATACLIGVGRLAYLDKYPDQVFADRYLVWACLFWMGVGLMLLSLADSRRRLLRIGLLIFACVLPIAMLPFHEYGAGWGAAVYRTNQTAAAAAMSDLFDDRLFADDDAATLAQRVLSYRLLREGHLGPFRFAGTGKLGAFLLAEPLPEPIDISVEVQKTTAVTDARDARSGAHFEGVVEVGVRALRTRGPIAVIDPDRRIVGYALFSFVGKPMQPLSLSLPMKRGFEGYVNDHDPKLSYRLVSLDSEGMDGVAWTLAELPALTP